MIVVVVAVAAAIVAAAFPPLEQEISSHHHKLVTAATAVIVAVVVATAAAVVATVALVVVATVPSVVTVVVATPVKARELVLEALLVLQYPTFMLGWPRPILPPLPHTDRTTAMRIRSLPQTSPLRPRKTRSSQRKARWLVPDWLTVQLPSVQRSVPEEKRLFYRPTIFSWTFSKTWSSIATTSRLLPPREVSDLPNPKDRRHNEYSVCCLISTSKISKRQ